MSKHCKIALVLTLAVSMLAVSCGTRKSALKEQVEYLPAKREFRGAWVPTIHRNEYSRLTADQARNLLLARISDLRRAGCNAVIFQIRPEADAWYDSPYEPWSRFLTGVQGQAPNPAWDPLAFVIEECHKRGMEVHAWINPYRASANLSNKLSLKHPYHVHPEWFVTYNNQLFFDPGIPACRGYICNIVKDVVSRYDVDAIHMDDYFYPYPVAGEPFPDQTSFATYGIPEGYTPANKADWRRKNVNMLIKEIKSTILETKPWVRFGISPFGIYRNKRNWAKGSNTNGLQNYDDLYADVMEWEKRGWIDYVLPQLYWNIGNKAADYQELSQWWSKSMTSKSHLYFGQHIRRTMDGRQMAPKMLLARRFSQGNAWWPAEDIWSNYKGFADTLTRKYQKHPALLPEYSHMYQGIPDAVPSLHAEWVPDGFVLMWEDVRDQSRADPTKPYYYAVYAFPKGVKVDIDDPRALVSISNTPYYKLPFRDGKFKFTYVVTTIDRFWNESKAKKITVKL
ncbi:glycoside hydrolase family 10 protein [Porphyromonas pogonae]|uniref:glycoside hydrolase family 10 protein n=1 Tax=Porphyromonas pogonae TaxID=867595 RepID=UPI002E79436F|nr:family 10 glycosylhydrolase [Porphyromonas pogonae]